MNWTSVTYIIQDQKDKLWKRIKVLGPLILEINGNPKNIIMGENITLMPGVHLKNREDGKILLYDEVKLDSHVHWLQLIKPRSSSGKKLFWAWGGF